MARRAFMSLSPLSRLCFSLLLAVYTDTHLAEKIFQSRIENVYFDPSMTYICFRGERLKSVRETARETSRSISFHYYYYYFLISIRFIYSLIRFSRPGGLRRHEIFAKRIFFRGSGFQNNIVPESLAYTGVPAPTARTFPYVCVRRKLYSSRECDDKKTRDSLNSLPCFPCPISNDRPECNNRRRITTGQKSSNEFIVDARTMTPKLNIQTDDGIISRM